jgi:predicted ester cyclase
LQSKIKNWPNAELNHYEIIAEGDYVMIRWDWSFDNTKDIMGIPATGKRISEIKGIDLFRIENGKISEFWQYFNEMSFMQQMGAIPAE